MLHPLIYPPVCLLCLHWHGRKENLRQPLPFYCKEIIDNGRNHSTTKKHKFSGICCKFCEIVHKSIVFCNRMAYWLRKNNIYVVIFYLNIYACSDPSSLWRHLKPHSREKSSKCNQPRQGVIYLIK